MSATLVIDRREVPTADELVDVRVKVGIGNDALERLAVRLDRVVESIHDEEAPPLERAVTWEDVGRLFAVLDVAEMDIGLMQKYVAEIREHMVEVWLKVERGEDA